MHFLIQALNLGSDYGTRRVAKWCALVLSLLIVFVPVARREEVKIVEASAAEAQRAMETVVSNALRAMPAYKPLVAPTPRAPRRYLPLVGSPPHNASAWLRSSPH